MVSQLGTLLAKNDLVQLKKYIDENFDDSLATVKYNYGVSFNAFIEDQTTKISVKNTNKPTPKPPTRKQKRRQSAI